MPAQTTSPLDVLARLCERNGWALCLHLESPLGLSAQAQEQPSHLTTLDVVDPIAQETRRKMIQAGDLLARSVVGVAGHLDEAAGECLEALRAQRAA